MISTGANPEPSELSDTKEKLMQTTQEQLKHLKEKANACRGCSLCENRDKIVFSDGCEYAPIMFIGEAPDKKEDTLGIPFIGRAGQLFRKMLSECGFKDDDFYITNTVKCRPPENRKPTKQEKSACFSFLDTQINLINPKYIVLMGSVALESFILDRKLSVTKAHGQIFEIGNRKFIPIFHPAYLLRYFNEYENSPRDLFRKDLTMIKGLIKNENN